MARVSARVPRTGCEMSSKIKCINLFRNIFNRHTHAEILIHSIRYLRRRFCARNRCTVRKQNSNTASKAIKASATAAVTDSSSSSAIIGIGISGSGQILVSNIPICVRMRCSSHSNRFCSSLPHSDGYSYFFFLQNARPPRRRVYGAVSHRATNNKTTEQRPTERMFAYALWPVSFRFSPHILSERIARTPKCRPATTTTSTACERRNKTIERAHGELSCSSSSVLALRCVSEVLPSNREGK